MSNLFELFLCIDKEWGSGTISTKKKRVERSSGEKLRAKNPLPYPINTLTGRRPAA